MLLVPATGPWQQRYVYCILSRLFETDRRNGVMDIDVWSLSSLTSITHRRKIWSRPFDSPAA
jgi:hypothetical protein